MNFELQPIFDGLHNIFVCHIFNMALMFKKIDIQTAFDNVCTHYWKLIVDHISKPQYNIEYMP